MDVASHQRLNDSSKLPERDYLTGLYGLEYFYEQGERLLKSWRNCGADQQYVLIYFDIYKFKVVNDVFGVAEGDRLLKYVASIISDSCTINDLVGRVSADKFVVLLNTSTDVSTWIKHLLDSLHQYDLPFEIVCNLGIYRLDDKDNSLSTCVDRAILAQSTIKGNYVQKYAYYDESMRQRFLSEQEIAGSVNIALETKQFVVYFQPQFNHSTGTMVGAEALVRWQHPVKGLIPPNVFIPIMENTGFIFPLDLYVFEQACIFLRQCLDGHTPVVPISSNFSPYDIFQPSFVDNLEQIRQKYNVPAHLLRVEITESAVMGGSEKTNEVVHRLNKRGYLVEMDDFGSGYSSLNVLKEIDFNIIKLDMKFLRSDNDKHRGGTILSAVIGMLAWLDIQVIAEGVETLQQADYLQSVGCDYMQGYFYSKPLPAAEFRSLLLMRTISSLEPRRQLVEGLSGVNFWDPDSKETLFFNKFVGAAAIITYQDGKIYTERVNKKFLRELGMNLTEREIVKLDFAGSMDENNHKIYIDTIRRAIETGEEQECETWRNIHSGCCGDEHICLHSSITQIGQRDKSYIFFSTIRNVTREKMAQISLEDNERRFKAASEQANIYYWEYIVDTHEMHPCFRCMRDLGFPAVLTNYPDSAIEMGFFPPEVADMYRDWHRQIAEGLNHLRR